MAPFRFRLDRVLKLRHQEVDAARRVLGAALAVQEEAARALAAVTGQIEVRMAVAAAQEARGMTAAEFATSRRHITFLQRQAERAEQELAAAQAETARCRQVLVETRSREKVLDKLRERRLAQHGEETARVHQGFLDELAVQSRRQRINQ